MREEKLWKFGRHLAAFRKARGWTQERLALESGMDRSQLSATERGYRNINLLNLCKLADTLGVSLSELMEFERK